MPDCTLPSQPNPQHLKLQYFKIDRLNVENHLSQTELVQAAVDNATTYLESLLSNQETASIILATGNSQLDFLERLIQSSLDWSRVVFFHLDEYLGILASHPGSFRYYLQQRVASKITNCRFNFIEGDAVEPLQECDRYSHLLTSHAPDLCLLGIGDNGHLAFNEPGIADFQDPYLVKLVKLAEKTRVQQVNGGFYAELDHVPKYAYTLTIPAICQAKQIICLAPGKHKAEVVKQTLIKQISSNFPATILRTLSQATLYCQDLDYQNLDLSK